MSGFLQAIPAAAASPYAFAAYAIAAMIFIFIGSKLRSTQLALARIDLVPESERRRALEIATGVVLPEEISPEEWLRNNRTKSLFALLGAVLIAAFAVVTISLLNPTKADLAELNRTITDAAAATQESVGSGTKVVQGSIYDATNKLTAIVEDSALANLETMFPLAVRTDRDVDSTIMTINGSPRQQLISYDHNLEPMDVYWGDRFHYMIFSDADNVPSNPPRVFLEIVSDSSRIRIPLRIDQYSEQEVRIPGSSPAPMSAFIVNEGGLSGVRMKITIYSADRERGRQDFREALMNTSLGSAARRNYLELNADGVRLRNGPSFDSLVLRTMREGTYLKVKEHNDDWCNVRMPEGREGWLECAFLRPMDQAATDTAEAAGPLP